MEKYGVTINLLDKLAKDIKKMKKKAHARKHKQLKKNKTNPEDMPYSLGVTYGKIKSLDNVLSHIKNLKAKYNDTTTP